MMWFVVALSVTKAGSGPEGSWSINGRGPLKPAQVNLRKVAVLEGKALKGNLPPLREIRLRENRGYVPFLPQAPGDGWILPSGVITDSWDEWTPTIAVDGYGVLWTAVNNLYDDTSYYYTVDLYYSSDAGLSWNFSGVRVGGDGLDLGDPVLAYDPSTNSLLLTFDAYNWYYGDYDVAICRWDITGQGSVDNFSYVWIYPTSANEMVPALAVERGHSPNYAFVSYEAYDGTYYYVFTWRFNPTNLTDSTYVNGWYDSNGNYIGQVWSNASDRVVQVTFKGGGSTWDSCVYAYYAYSLNRGDTGTWNAVALGSTGVGYVFQSTSAAAYGSDYAVWTVQVNPSSSDGNIYMLWSSDNGQTWPAGYWLENSAISLDSRMPMLIAEKSDCNYCSSEFFYFGAYREVVSGSGEGNYWFLMAPVGNADDSADWRTPPNVDQFVIPSTLLPNYNIQEANWAQLHLVSFPFNGGYTPGVVWTHKTGDGNHDIFFARPIVPLFTKVGQSPEERASVRLLTPVSSGELRFQVPPELRGARLRVYRADGSLALETELRERVKVDLPAGAYHWRVGKAGGALLVVR